MKLQVAPGRRRKVNPLTAAAAAAVLLALFIVPTLLNNTYLMLIITMCGIYTIATSGLDLLFGYSGQISLGHAAFYCLGAYGTGILSKLLHINPWLSIVLASIVATLIGVLFALPTTRLKFMFLSLVTTGFGELVYQAVVNFWPDITGSTSGFKGIPKFRIGEFVIKDRIHYLYLVLIFTVLFLFIKQRIVNSRIGRAFIAIRENTEAAGAMGIKVRRYKPMAFGISAFFTAFAGALYAHYVGFISPETFLRQTSVLFLTMVLFGGMGTFIGPIIGSTFLITLTETVQAFGQYQQLIYGVFIIIVVLFMPTGLSGLIRLVQEKLFPRKGVTDHAAARP